MKIKIISEEKTTETMIDLKNVQTLLVVGETGVGKSKLMENIYLQLKSQLGVIQLSFLMLDMTRVEFTDWKNDPYLISQVIYKSDEAFEAFEMALNNPVKDKLTVIHIEECDMVVDDLERFERLWIQANKTKNVLVVFSTSRPATNILTDSILKNTDLIIAFRMSTAEQSKRVLGLEGAEKLNQMEKIILYKDKLISVG